MSLGRTVDADDPIWGPPQAVPLALVSSQDNPIPFRPASLRHGIQIPPRQWLYGTMLLRGFVSTIIAPAGVGKTAFTLAVMTSLAMGKGLLHEYVHQRVKTLYFNLEDSEEEFDRRMAALMIHHRLNPDALQGMMFVATGRERRLIMAQTDVDGMTVIYPDRDNVVQFVKQMGIGAIFVDPFVNSHEVKENDNGQVNQAVRAWAECADLANCGIQLVHHTRKGAIPGDPDSGRGANAMIGASRDAKTLTSMDAAVAKDLGIPEAERRLHIRLDDAKQNLAPPGAKAVWYRLASVNLGNGTPDYPHGDSVQAVEAWEPPKKWLAYSPAELNIVLDRIADGPAPGEKFFANKRGVNNRSKWVGTVLMQTLDCDEAQAAAIVKTWLATGLLVPTMFTSSAARKQVEGVDVNDAKRPTLDGEHGPSEESEG